MNKANPSNNPKVLNVGPGKIVHAKPFNTKPNIIEEIDKIIPFCFVIILSVLRARAGIGYNVLRLALSGVAPAPSHHKYNKTFHSAADFP